MTEANYPTGSEQMAAPRADLRPAQISDPPLSPQPGQAVASARPPIGAISLIPRKQGAWGLWWLCVITFSIYYFIWYDRINSELSAILGQPRRANSQWWNQIIPFWSLVGLGATAKRLNAAHALVGSPTRVGVFTSWFWAPGWFGSQTRYLQRRVNILHDVLASRTARPGY
ncbi:hypothetical protein MXD62_35440 [Frankia sp. Mgl5]|uniref:hypothetical protein n=1 Tax=Frankia sp. Mgl5 TaxID=2933793 RepID=UPI00200DAF07|nr:hypothetical protein [Frankia sp. Mgl5]MCK9932377.1 hypothetical protein [Frankia sp. Mgl5]